MDIVNKFWRWYERNYKINLTVSTLLFTIQVVHLYWLTAHVVLHRLIGVSFWDPSPLLQNLLIVADYTEIPALISVSLVYINELRKKFNRKSILFLLFLNSQWLHIFWITDEFVIEQLTQTVKETILPAWLAWLAITIDYLELPVIYDTIKKLFKALQKKDIKEATEAFKED